MSDHKSNYYYCYIILVFCTTDFSIASDLFLAVLGVISNTLTLAALISGKLYKNWTYVMLMNLSTTDLLLWPQLRYPLPPWCATEQVRLIIMCMGNGKDGIWVGGGGGGVD